MKMGRLWTWTAGPPEARPVKWAGTMLEAQGDLGGCALSYGAKAGSKKTSCVQGLSGPPFPHLQTVRPTSPPSGAVAERLRTHGHAHVESVEWSLCSRPFHRAPGAESRFPSAPWAPTPNPEAEVGQQAALAAGEGAPPHS